MFPGAIAMICNLCVSVGTEVPAVSAGSGQPFKDGTIHDGGHTHV